MVWRPSPPSFLGALALLLGAALLVAIHVGGVLIPWRDIWQILFQGPRGQGPLGDILWQIRLPRILLAAAVGAALGGAGTLFQGLFRNPMADPYVIGVSSGAALGAALYMVVLWHTGWALGLPGLAFLGAALTLLLVYGLSRQNGHVPVTYLLLAGVAVSSFLAALVALLVYFYPENLRSLYFWLLGSFAGATWQRLAWALPYIAGTLFLGHLFLVRPLNLLLAGEEQAHHLGLAVEKAKRWILLSGAFLTAVAVALSGMIGFVGLVAPHAVRLLVGPDHRRVFLGSAFLGGTFMVLADSLARTLLSPQELPVGIVTSLVGSPFFLYLL
ncbi:MAG: iron ABC transporter permease, partial [Bacillota bacterium]|nr:iron ABC transporter permease [Bacillota bacterium]